MPTPNDALAVDDFRGAIIARDGLANVVAGLRNQRKRIVTTNGVFDLLHVGHTRYLQQARCFGDVLIVGVNSDDSARRLNKGPNRPLIPDVERAEMLVALRCVDFATIFDEDDPRALLNIIRPDVHVKGGDYTLDRILEREVVERHGGRVIVGINVPNRSTTRIIRAMTTNEPVS